MTTISKPFLALSSLIGVTLWSQSAWAQSYVVAEVGDVNGGISTIGNAINDSGQVTGFTVANQAFLYSDGALLNFGDPSNSDGQAINASGQVTGFSDGPSGQFAFLYTNGVLQDISPSGTGVGGYGRAINATGQVTGYFWPTGSSAVSHAFLYSNGASQDLGVGGLSDSVGWAINDNGQITGYLASGNSISSSTYPFLYSNGVLQNLGDLGGTCGYGIAINVSGQVTGYACTASDDMHAFLYSNGVMQDLGTLGGKSSQGSAINASGQVIGVAYTASGIQHAFLYTNGAMQDLFASSGGSSYAQSINDSGQVVGAFTMTGGSKHAFLYASGKMLDLNSIIANNPLSQFTTLSNTSGITSSGYILASGIDSRVGVTEAFVLQPVHPLPMTLSCPAAISKAGASYSSALVAAGGISPYTFSISLGSLPPGLVLNAATGAIIGTPSAAGAFSFTGSAVDFVGPVADSATSSCTVTVDGQAPSVTPNVTGKLGTNGWYISATTTLAWTVTGSPTPTTSGCGTVSVPQTTGTTYTCSATNPLGTASNSVTIKEDSVKPSVAVTTPKKNAAYSLNKAVLSSYSCLDATSGVASCVGTVANGAAVNTTTLGTQTFSVIGTDNAGNTTTKSVLYSVEPQAATPVFSLPAGTYTGAQIVTITDATAGAVIYYTLDGSTPTTSSPVYGGPITISTTHTLKAVAIASGDTLSAVNSAKYTIK